MPFTLFRSRFMSGSRPSVESATRIQGSMRAIPPAKWNFSTPYTILARSSPFSTRPKGSDHRSADTTSGGKRSIQIERSHISPLPCLSCSFWNQRSTISSITASRSRTDGRDNYRSVGQIEAVDNAHSVWRSTVCDSFGWNLLIIAGGLTGCLKACLYLPWSFMSASTGSIWKFMSLTNASREPSLFHR